MDRRADHDRLDDVVQRLLARVSCLRGGFAGWGRSSRVSLDRASRRIEVAAPRGVMVMFAGGLVGLLVLVATGGSPGVDPRPSSARLRQEPPRADVMDLRSSIVVADAQ